jgi:hypothetical protein
VAAAAAAPGNGVEAMTDSVARVLASLQRPDPPQIFLVHGDLVLAEPAAEKVAAALAARHGGAFETHRHPAALAPLLQDLRTFSLFGGAKVLLAIDTAAFADRSGAADLIDDAEDAMAPARGAAKAGASANTAKTGGEVSGEGALSSRERLAATRLMQALLLFEIDAAHGSVEEAVAQLPPWVLEGGRTARRGRGGRARGPRQMEELRAGLASLLEAARREGIAGGVSGDLSDLAAAIAGGLPADHALVFAEREVAADHPLVRRLEERGAVAATGEVKADGGGWMGLERVAAELEEQTEVGISRAAMEELARRTLRKAGDPRRGGDANRTAVAADSTARLAAEYRKLANLARAAGSARIELHLVEESVEDRGEEDVWKLLDAIGAGRSAEALDRLRRLLAAADDPLAARLSFFSLLATFCRRLTAIRGILRLARLPSGEANYSRFKARLAPALQGELPGGGKNPLAGINPYPLHRAYLAACRISDATAARLPWVVLETEMQLKGESSEADAALANLVVRLGTAMAQSNQPTQPARPQRPAPAEPGRRSR